MVPRSVGKSANVLKNLLTMAAKMIGNIVGDREIARSALSPAEEVGRVSRDIAVDASGMCRMIDYQSRGRSIAP